MTEINVKGDVVDNESSAFYDFYEMPYISPKVVQNSLSNATDEVFLKVASTGGDVFAASEIYTMLREYPGSVTAHIQGLAASAATVIAMAADHIEISPTAQMMIHKASTDSGGNADDHRKSSEILDGLDKSIAAAYENKTGLDEGKLLNMMAQGTWLTAKQAVDYGFADGIMFEDSEKPQFTNSTEERVKPAAIDKFLSMKNMVKEYKELIKNKDSENDRSKDNKGSQLLNSKLAILMHKKNGGA